jgi:hypothetical protein
MVQVAVDPAGRADPVAESDATTAEDDLRDDQPDNGGGSPARGHAQVAGRDCAPMPAAPPRRQPARAEPHSVAETDAAATLTSGLPPRE